MSCHGQVLENPGTLVVRFPPSQAPSPMLQKVVVSVVIATKKKKKKNTILVTRHRSYIYIIFIFLNFFLSCRNIRGGRGSLEDF